MPQNPLTDRSIFLAAIDIASLAERDAYLARVCGDNAPLRAEVQALLAAHAQSGDMLDVPDQVSPTIDQPTERLGTQIGPYKLLQQIGEGGMGVVYMAEQSKPVERRVALKIIKPGIDTRQVIARFEAERQALAMMDHPNIAKVFEAGTTESGRPYFVMELVKGIPITRYCDEKHLSLQERLKLMIPVCQAIQHAHQKGIIHRDIKPTNVLVAQYDGRPVPKVIDFGVAKATAQKLTERTMFTELGQVVGTVEYMSPEQAELNQLDIDTRSDIYSLGVLLYELLAGTTPFDRQKLRSAAFHEMLRIIREDEPPKPSTSLSTSGTLASISANRQTDPARLSKAVRGELDWIVMKALEKDRNRRYETANGLASDIQRYLNDEHVQACPPSARYRFGKFVRKNRATLTTATIVALALLIGIAVSTWQAVRATNAETQARANETKATAAADSERAAKQAETIQRKWAEANEQKALKAAEAERKAKQAEAAQRRRAETSEQQAKDRLVEVERQRMQAEKNYEAALDAVDRMLAHVDDQELNDVPRVGPLRRKILKDALSFYERIPMQSELSLEARFQMGWRWNRIANTSYGLNESEQARQAHQAAIEIFAALAVEQPGEVKFLAALGAMYENANYIRIDAGEVTEFTRKASDLYAQLAQKDPEEKSWVIRQANTLCSLAGALSRLGKRDEAIECATRALNLLERSPTATGADRGAILYQAAFLRANEAERDELFRRSLVEFRTYFDGDKSSQKGTYERDQYAGRLRVIGETIASRRPDEAEQLLDECIAINKELYGTSPRHRNAAFYQILAILSQARQLRRLEAMSPKSEDPIRSAARKTKAETLFQEAITLQRNMVSRFAVREDPYDLVKLLEEETKYLLGQVAGAAQAEDSAARKQAAALRDEALLIVKNLNPDTGKEYLNRGAIFESLGNLKAALADYDAASKLGTGTAPDRAVLNSTYSRLGERLQESGQLVDAEAAFRSAIAISEKLTAEFPARTYYWTQYAHSYNRLAKLLAATGRPDEAEKAYRQVAVGNNKTAELNPNDGKTLNNLAWGLATSAEPKLRDGAQAVQLAEQAVKLNPNEGGYWNTFGAAQYRAGDWKAAIATLEKSTEFSKGGNSFDWFFLAMSHWQLGEKEKARTWYDKAVEWMNVNQPQNEELKRFRAEAAELLGIKDEPKPEKEPPPKPDEG